MTHKEMFVMLVTFSSSLFTNNETRLKSAKQPKTLTSVALKLSTTIFPPKNKNG